jgi:hypothetical protein
MQRTDGLCFGRGEAGYRLLFLNNSFIGFHLDHRFDDKTSESDAKIANMQTDGAISHMQFHRYWFKASAEAAQDSNDYVTKGYFQHNLEGLHDRGLFAPLFLPQDNFSAEDAGSHSSIVKVLRSKQVFSNCSFVRTNDTMGPIWGTTLRVKIESTESDRMMLYAVMEAHAAPDQLFGKTLQCQVLVDSKSIATVGCRCSREENSTFPQVGAGVQSCFCRTNVPISALNFESKAYVTVQASLYVNDAVLSVISENITAQQVHWRHYWHGGLDHWRSEALQSLGSTGLALCVDASNIPLSIETMPLYLEFIQLHISLGVRHIWLLLPLTSESIHFTKMMLIFHTYIRDGRLTLLAQPKAPISQHVFLLQCSVQAHLFASHIASWRLDNFLIVDNLTAILPLSSMECLRIERFAVEADDELLRRRQKKSTPLWIGESFSGKVARRIRDTGPGLESGLILPLTYPAKSVAADASSCSHVAPKDGTFLQVFQLFGEPLPLDASDSAAPLRSPSHLYTQDFYPAVRAALAERHLDLIVDIPRRWLLPESATLPDANWVKFEHVYLNRAKNAILN